MKIYKKYNNKGLATLTIFVILSLLGLGVVMTNQVQADDTNINYTTLLTTDKLNEILQSYFNNLNTSQIYNTYNSYITNKYYNITNVTNNSYYYYTNTYLNQTFNSYITNEYYEDNYYNTYNTYNQTFLNQTFIDNNYYTTNNNINNSYLESMMTSLNNIWDYINNKENEKINLGNLTNSIIDLNGSKCNQIEFMFKDSNILSIYDTLGLGISTQLSQVTNVNFTNSVFINNNNEPVINNLVVDYDKINNGKHSFEVDKNNNLNFEINNSEISSNNELLLNMAFQDLWVWNKVNVLTISYNNTPKLQLYIKEDDLYIEDLTNGNKIFTSVDNLNTWENNFNIYSMYFDKLNNKITLSIDDNQILELDSNPFNNLNGVYDINFNRNTNSNVYIRSLYLNSNRLKLINSKYVLDNVEYEFNNNNWNKAEIYILSNSVLYNINNNIISKDYSNQINQTKENYHLVINTNETSLFNLYCRN